MTDHRLTLARDAGVLRLPEEGRIGLFRLRADAVPQLDDPARADVIQTFAPDHDALSARGLAVATVAGGPYAAALVQATRSKVETRALIAAACETTEADGLVLVDGQKVDGIDGLLRDLRRKGLQVEVYPKAHGRLIWFTRPTDTPLADWATPRIDSPEGFQTAAGVFSADRLDVGSALLATHLPPLKGRVADLGAGWGFLSRAILENADVKSLDLIEAEQTALDCARANIDDPRARFHWADVTRWQGEAVDTVVMNPPFHNGRAADPSLGAAFITAAARLLRPSGSLWMVANRHLPYEAALTAAFRKHQQVADEGGFKILQASHPRSGR